MAVMWPVGEDMVDHLDKVGKEEIETLRSIIQVRHRRWWSRLGNSRALAHWIQCIRPGLCRALGSSR